MFKFTMKATQCDPSGYYFPRWDIAQSIAVVAETRDRAEEMACSVLGSTPRMGWHWVFEVISIEPAKGG